MNDTMIEAMSRPSFVLHLCSVIVENRRRSRFGIDSHEGGAYRAQPIGNATKGEGPSRGKAEAFGQIVCRQRGKSYGRLHTRRCDRTQAQVRG